MLRNSFIHLDEVGPATERRIWSQGILDWDSFLKAPAVDGMGERLKLRHDEELCEALALAETGRVSEVARWFPRNETWRLYHDLSPRLFLDIETTGLSPDMAKVTCVGLSDGKRCEVLVRGQTLTADALMDAFNRSKLLVTFNGQRFDVPFIERNMGIRLPDITHLDLMHAFRGIGIRGGLKRIEVQLAGEFPDRGIARSDEVQGVDGLEAVRLWWRYERRQDKEALDKLVAYNRADVDNMKPLAEIMYQLGRERSGVDSAGDCQ